MVIDVDKKYVLTNYGQVRKGGKATDSDHATEFMDLDLKIVFEKPERRELWNFKNKEAQENFKVLTSETTEFSDCFSNKLPLLNQIANWKTVFNAFCRKAFQKIRITKKKFNKPTPNEVTKLIDERNNLMNTGRVEEAKELDETISNFEAELNRNHIMKHFKRFSEDPFKVNLGQVWKTMDRIWPKVGVTKPTAKKNHKGRVVSAPTEIKKLLAKEYKERLRTRPAKPGFEHLRGRRKRICNMKLKLAEANHSSLWTMADLEKALKDLKINKCRDHEGLINEIFRNNVIGDDLRCSIKLNRNK